MGPCSTAKLGAGNMIAHIAYTKSQQNLSLDRLFENAAPEAFLEETVSNIPAYEDHLTPPLFVWPPFSALHCHALLMYALNATNSSFTLCLRQTRFSPFKSLSSIHSS